MWEKQLCRYQGQWRRRGRRHSRHQRRDSPAAHGEDHGEAGCPPAAHGGPQWSRYPPAACGRDPTPEQVDAWRRLWPRGEPVMEQTPARTCGPMERGAHVGAGLLVGLVNQQGTHAGAACSWTTAPHGKDACRYWTSFYNWRKCITHTRRFSELLLFPRKFTITNI